MTRNTSSHAVCLLTAAALVVSASLCVGEVIHVSKKRMPSDREVAPSNTQAAAPRKVVWNESLDAAYFEAQRINRPILLVAGASGVVRRQFDEVFADAQVVRLLPSFALVRIDPQNAKADARATGVAVAPALRLMTTAGRVIASHDDVPSAQQLAMWLNESQKLATAAGPNADGAKASAVDLKAEIERLASADASDRAAAFDLLESRGAPLEGVDPWDPKSVTVDRRTSLEAWATASTKGSPSTTQAVDLTTAIDLEIGAMLAAPTAVEARAVRDRLAGYGAAVVPVVSTRLVQLQQSGAGENLASHRQRLLALRYHASASSELASKWPGGFDCLSMVDPLIRRAAMDELASLATSRDVQLLRELFTDNDPFLRERSLRVLRKLGTDETGKAIVNLLSDPDLNVRAAVLKVLAESPEVTLAGDVVAYASQETDDDLVVHAVRVLQETEGTAATDGLKALLEHKQWRVRGEAAEALRERLQSMRYESDPKINAIKAGIMIALTKRLEDDDGYVVAKAAEALISSGLSTAAGQLMTAAEKKPELARDLLKAMRFDDENAKPFLPRIRKMASHTDPGVRAAAVSAVAQLAPKTAGTVLKAAIVDNEVTVRVAAIEALVGVLRSLAPDQAGNEENSGGGFFRVFSSSSSGSSKKETDLGKWAESFTADESKRPKWLNDLKEPLKQSFADAAIANTTKADAAVALCAMGEMDIAMPVLLATTTDHARAAAAMFWLPWERRLSLYETLTRSAPAGQTGEIIEQFVSIPDPRAAALLWKSLDGKVVPGQDDDQLATVYNALRTLYLGERYYDTESIPKARRNTISDELTTQASNAAHSSRRRRVAMALLLAVDSPKAAAVTTTVYEDTTTPAATRADALRVRLLSMESPQVTAVAVAAVAEAGERNDATSRDIALAFLAAGSSSIQYISDSIYLQSSTGWSETSVTSSGQPIEVKPPAGLDIAIVAKAFADAKTAGNTDAMGYAGYLLATASPNAEAVSAVATAARAHDLRSPWSRLFYRAAARLDGDTHVPMLNEIFDNMKTDERWSLPELYWTLRPMKGPEILKLRKRMRTEVGMDNLK